MKKPVALKPVANVDSASDVERVRQARRLVWDAVNELSQIRHQEPIITRQLLKLREVEMTLWDLVHDNTKGGIG